MAVQLFRLASESFPKISSTTSQAAFAYFHVMSVTAALTEGEAYSITKALWKNNAGNTVTAFATGQGLNSLSINGVLQQDGLYNVGISVVKITPAVAMTLKKGYPITLQTYNAKADVVISASVSSLVAIP